MKTRVVSDVLATEKLCQELGDKVCVLLRDLLKNERFSHGDNFEKLGLSKRSVVVYSLRLNKEKRVLLTKKKEGTGYFWIVLDYLPHHEYHKSPFLQSQYLTRYLEHLPMLISVGRSDSKIDSKHAASAATSTTVSAAAIATTASRASTAVAIASVTTAEAVASTAAAVVRGAATAATIAEIPIGSVATVASPAITTTITTALSQAIKSTASSGIMSASACNDSTVVSSSSSGATAEYMLAQELYYFNQELIILNHDQEQALLMSEPMLLTGMPGSGKSCVATSYLTECLYRTQLNANQNSLLYVAESDLLVEQIAKSFYASSLGQTPAAKHVLFLSYDNLLRKEIPEIKDLKRVGKAEFSEWFNGLQRKDVIDLKTQLGTKATELVYQELRMMSGMDYKEYQAVGERGSPLWNVGRHFEVATKGKVKKKKSSATRKPLVTSVQSEEAKKGILRDMMYKIKEDYCAYLNKQKQYDSSFFDVLSKIKTRYSHIAVDEAQDFSTLQLRMLYGLAVSSKQGPSIAFFADSHQSVEDNFPKHDFFKTLLGVKNIGVLPGTYRCSKAVIDVANTVLGIKYHVTGGLMEKGGQGYIAESPVSRVGCVRYLPDKKTEQDEATQTRLAQLTASPWCAVITLENLVQEAQARFPGAIVLTPKQAKGLEYDSIILYGMLQHPCYAEINKALLDFVMDDAKVSVHRAKAGEADYAYNALLNGFFTAITRARYDLDVLLPSQGKELHPIKNLVDILKRTSSQTDLKIETKPETKKNPERVATRESWQEEIRRQIANGNRDVAFSIAQSHLGMSKIDFNNEFIKNKKENSDDNNAKEMQKDHKSELIDSRRNSNTSREIQKDHKSSLNTNKNQSDKKVDFASMHEGTAASSLTTAETKIIVDKIVTPEMRAVISASDDKAFTPMMNFLKQPDFLIQLFHVDAGGGKALYDVLSHKKVDLLHQILMGFFKKRDPIASQLTLDALCKIYISKTNTSHQSSLFCFIVRKKGLALLDSIITGYHKDWAQSPAFWKALFVDGVVSSIFTHFNGLYWLCGSPEGQALLGQWVAQFPDIVKTQEFRVALCLARPAAAGADANASGLYWLCVNPEGRAILGQWVAQFPDIVKTQEFIAALCRALPSATAGVDANASGVYWLCRNPKGQAILGQSAAQFPDILKTQKFSIALCLALPAAAGVYANTSSLYWLCRNPEGRAVLGQWVAQFPDIVKTQEFMGALCLIRPAAVGADANTSGLFWLCVSADGRVLLSKLVALYPELCKADAFVAALNCIWVDTPLRQTSPLSLLQDSADGLELIKNVLKNNPELSSVIKSNRQPALTVESAASIQKAQELRFFTTKSLSAASGVACDAVAIDVKAIEGANGVTGTAVEATAATNVSAAVATVSSSAEVLVVDQKQLMGFVKK